MMSNLHSNVCLEITEQCQNSCIHCYNYWRYDKPKKDKPLETNEILNIVEKIRQETALTHIAISGGEPLLRKEFTKIVKSLIDKGFKVVVITNGVLLTKQLLNKLPAGINYEITLFSHEEQKHNFIAGNKVFDTVINNIFEVEKHKSFFTMAFVATELNALDIYKTAELGLALGAKGIMFNRMNMAKRTRPKSPENIVPKPATIYKSLTLLEELVNKYKISAFSSVPIPPCFVDVLKFPSIHFGWCPRGGKDAYYTISTHGFLRPCNHSSLLLGDLKKNTYSDLVKSDLSTNFWNYELPECLTCTHPLKDVCKGGCIAAAYEYNGFQYKRDPICDLAG